MSKQADIVRIVSDYFNLKGCARNYAGPCPFNGEKTPSSTEYFPNSKSLNLSKIDGYIPRNF